MWLTFLTTLLNIIDLVLPLLIAVAYFTLAERKIINTTRSIHHISNTLDLPSGEGVSTDAAALSLVRSTAPEKTFSYRAGHCVG